MNITRLELFAGAENASKITVLIDVFRAFSTSALLFEYGIKEIILVGDIEDAHYLAKEKGFLLIGEQNGIMPEKFDYGNSPTLIIKQGRKSIEGRTAILYTSAGTRGAIAASRKSELLLLGSFVTANATANVVKNAIEQGLDNMVSIVALGIDGKMASVEDRACGDYIEHLLIGKNYSHFEFMQSLLNVGFINNVLNGNYPQYPCSDITFSIQQDLFNFALVVEKKENTSLYQNFICLRR